MAFAVVCRKSIRPRNECGIVERIPVALDQPNDGVDAVFPARLDYGLARFPRNGLGGRPGVVGALEHIAGDRALRKHDQLSACLRGLLYPLQNRGAIARAVANLRVHLHDRKLK